MKIRETPKNNFSNFNPISQICHKTHLATPAPGTSRRLSIALSLLCLYPLLNPSQLRWQPLSGSRVVRKQPSGLFQRAACGSRTGYTDRSRWSGRASPLLQLFAKVSLTRMPRRWCAIASWLCSPSLIRQFDLSVMYMLCRLDIAICFAISAEMSIMRDWVSLL